MPLPTRRRARRLPGRYTAKDRPDDDDMSACDHRPLVTTAMHMRCALARFTNAGWNVAPYPVAYTTSAISACLCCDATQQFEVLRDAIHERVALVAYRLLGRSDRDRLVDAQHGLFKDGKSQRRHSCR